MKLEGVRTRFAPSPTGYMHVGNLRTCLLYTSLGKSIARKREIRWKKLFAKGKITACCLPCPPSIYGCGG